MLIRAILNNQDSSSRNWVFGRGYSTYKSGQSAVAQDIKSALLEFENDCYWALQNGIDWLTRLGFHNQKEALDNDVINTIQSRSGVIAVQNFESQVTDRNYFAQCQVISIYSENPINFSFNQGV
jgi:hypothetical protein